VVESKSTFCISYNLAVECTFETTLNNKIVGYTKGTRASGVGDINAGIISKKNDHEVRSIEW